MQCPFLAGLSSSAVSGGLGPDLESLAVKKGLQKNSNFVRPLVTLSPFVPRLLMDEIAAQDAKYRAFDQVGFCVFYSLF